MSLSPGGSPETSSQLCRRVEDSEREGGTHGEEKAKGERNEGARVARMSQVKVAGPPSGRPYPRSELRGFLKRKWPGHLSSGHFRSQSCENVSGVSGSTTMGQGISEVRIARMSQAGQGMSEVRLARMSQAQVASSSPPPPASDSLPPSSSPASSSPPPPPAEPSSTETQRT